MVSRFSSMHKLPQQQGLSRLFVRMDFVVDGNTNKGISFRVLGDKRLDITFLHASRRVWISNMLKCRLEGVSEQK